MLTIIIPTLNAGPQFERVLSAVTHKMEHKISKQLIVADGGSTDKTLVFAENFGAQTFVGERGRGKQLAAGGQMADGDWLLFLHADTVLETGWEREVLHFIKADKGGDPKRAAVFRFRLNDTSRAALCLEWIVALRCKLFALPYGDQGLLISREFYNSLGGFSEIPLMEDVDLVRRIGRKHLFFLDHGAVTDAARYQREGYVRRMVRNASCLTMWFAGVNPERIAGFYK